MKQFENYGTIELSEQDLKEINDYLNESDERFPLSKHLLVGRVQTAS
jgi:hypothetical protein